MSRRFRWTWLVGLSSFLAAPVNAQQSCDCTAIVGSCRAEVEVRDGWIDVSSDRMECSRVDYFVDGLPFVAVVVGGTERQNRVARAGDAEVIVQSCQVCRAAAAPQPAAASAPASGGEDSEADGDLTPLIEVAPQYPQTARERGIEGHVDVQFTVAAAGTVESPAVTASEPAGIFDQAALAAVSRWRYRADFDRAPQTMTERIRFSLADSASRAGARGAAAAPTGPLNRCVREQAVYNYGDMVDVDLINTCAEPLLVYACAAGTAQYVGRWVCTSSELAQRVLVAPGDPRIDMTTAVQTPAGSRDFRFAGEFRIARAPNTQYWWVACGRSDAACRENAGQWLRSLDRQVVGVDPQTRSSLTVARSY